MIRIRDTLAGEEIRFHYVNKRSDLEEVRRFICRHFALAVDTESTGINCYRPGWRLKTVQIGDDVDSYIIPAKYKRFIWWAMSQPIKWIGHNGPHDIRSIDAHLGQETGVVCAGETYIPAHHLDSRDKSEGGTGHKLEELAKAHIDRNADKWDKARKEAFKQIYIKIPGQVYKSGPRKGQQKVRKAKLSEGWALIDPKHPAMVAYAGADPILTYRLWRIFQPVVREFYELYQFDKEVAHYADRLQRRGMLIDVEYTKRLNKAYSKRAQKLRNKAWEFGCDNVQSGDQVAATLIELGAKLRAKTDSGKYKTDAELLRKLSKQPSTNGKVKRFITLVLGIKQTEKRKASYTEHILDERDENNRVHASINSLKARTTRMSVAGPPLQQLPTQDREEELLDG